MSNYKYEVLTADKPEDGSVTLAEARRFMASQFPGYRVEVTETEDSFVARIAADDEAGKPPFLEEADDAAADEADDSDEDGEKKAPKKKDDSEDSEPKGDKEDKEPADDLSKALEALNTLKSVLPKLESLLKGGDPVAEGGPGGGPDIPGGPPPELLEGGGPSPEEIGPVPGGPPVGGPGARGMGGPPPGMRPPRPSKGLDKRKKPAIGVPAFSSVNTKFVFRPAEDEDGSLISLAQAAAEISQHPKYASYEVTDLRLDTDSGQYVAELQLRQE